MLNIAVLDDNKIFLDKIYDQIIELLPDFQIRVDLFTESSHLLEERKKKRISIVSTRYRHAKYDRD